MLWALPLVGACASGDQAPVDARFVSVRWGPAEMCGVTNVGTLECSPAIWDLPAAELGAVPIVDFGGNYGFTCIVSEVQGLLCTEPYNPDPDFPAPIVTVRGEYADVRVAARRVCADDEDGIVQCWGDGARDPASAADQKPIKASPYVSWDVGDWGHGCGVATSGGIECWGGNADDELMVAPVGTFTSVAVGYSGCAVRDTGGIACWNVDDAWWQGHDPPAFAQYTKVDVGMSGACGLTIDGEIECWGREEGADGSSWFLDAGNTYEGPYVDLALGDSNMVAGLRADGGIQIPYYGAGVDADLFYAGGAKGP